MLTLDVAVESYHQHIESNYIKTYGNPESGHIGYIIASLPVFEKLQRQIAKTNALLELLMKQNYK